MGSKNYLNILFLGVRNIGRALRIVDLGSDLRLDLLVDEEEGGRVGVLANLHCLLVGSIVLVWQYLKLKRNLKVAFSAKNREIRESFFYQGNMVLIS